jgi:hypothetical protein
VFPAEVDLPDDGSRSMVGAATHRRATMGGHVHAGERDETRQISVGKLANDGHVVRSTKNALSVPEESA